MNTEHPVPPPTTIRRARLRWHARRHPDHVLVGWYGVALRCGTCLGLSHPNNGLPARLLPRGWRL